MKFDITHLRLHNTGLSSSPFENAYDVVSHLGAVQSQDFAAAKWALGLRIKNSTDEKIEKDFNDGKILRTHVLRPTWHFVLPEHIRWMLALTAPRIKTFMGHYNKKLELTDAVFTKSNTTIIKALKENRYLTRQELKTYLEKAGIKTDVQRLAHIVMWAELDGLICSGPRRSKPASPKTKHATSRGGQFTYALLEKRAPKTKRLSHEESLEKLANLYFTSHGPAQLKDFSWWSGLSMKDATKALDLIRSRLNQETINGKMYWFFPNVPITHNQSPMAYLLSIYDEYTIAYKDRSDISEGRARDIERMISMGNALTSVIILDGKVVGTWKRLLKKQHVEITLTLFRTLEKIEKEELQKTADRYGTFLGMSPVLHFS